MAEAKRRQEAIALLKQKPKPQRARLKRVLHTIKTLTVFHFRNASARAEALRLYEVDAPLNSAEALTRAVRLGQILPKFVQPVQIQITTPAIQPMARTGQKPIRPLVMVVGRNLNPTEWADHVLAVAQINDGKGFRTPSGKEKNWTSTSLVMEASIAAGLCAPNAPERSKRGKAKAELRAETNEAIKSASAVPLKYLHSAARRRVEAYSDMVFKEAA